MRIVVQILVSYLLLIVNAVRHAARKSEGKTGTLVAVIARNSLRSGRRPHGADRFPRIFRSGKVPTCSHRQIGRLR